MVLSSATAPCLSLPPTPPPLVFEELQLASKKPNSTTHVRLKLRPFIQSLTQLEKGKVFPIYSTWYKNKLLTEENHVKMTQSYIYHFHHSLPPTQAHWNSPNPLGVKSASGCSHSAQGGYRSPSRALSGCYCPRLPGKTPESRHCIIHEGVRDVHSSASHWVTCYMNELNIPSLSTKPPRRPRLKF